AHAVVDPAACKDHLGYVPETFGLMGQVVGVNAYAMSSHQPRQERQEVPLSPGCLEHISGPDSHAGKDHSQLIDKGNVDVTLGIFNDLGGLSYFNRRSKVGA